MKTTHAAGTQVPMDFYKHFLVLEGLCVTRHNRTSFAYRPGDCVATPHVDASRAVNIASVSFDESATYPTSIHFITDTSLAYFKKEKIDELLENHGFLAASYQNLLNFNAHLADLRMTQGALFDSLRRVSSQAQ